MYAARFPAQAAGSEDCKELWVPAEDLDEFNRHIVGAIEAIAEYRNGVRVQSASADGDDDA